MNPGKEYGVRFAMYTTGSTQMLLEKPVEQYWQTRRRPALWFRWANEH